jgi:hypothetical protein
VLPAETGSIETPAAPAVEALVEPEHIALPQLPPPPLAPELSQPLVPSAPPLTEIGVAPAPVPAPVPTPAPAPEPAPERLADQPLPSSALPPPVAVAPAPSPAAAAPADSAAAAATAIADPLPPAVPAAPPPAVVVAPAVPVAEVSPIPPDPKPDVAATPPVDPTIDTIAFDLTGTVVAGDGPQGAVIHLYVDAELAGEGAVLDGRWEIFGAPLFAAPLQTLRAVAVDPETGRVLGETEISIELELPESAAPPALDDPVVDEIVPPRPGPDRIADAAPPPELPAPVAPVAAPPPELATAPSVETAPVETGPAATGPKVLPPLRTVVPRGESASVTILPESRSTLTESPGTGFAILGD